MDRGSSLGGLEVRVSSRSSAILLEVVHNVKTVTGMNGSHGVTLGSLCPKVPGAVSGASPGRKPSRVNRRSQFSLLIVRGDGTRVLRFNFPRPAVVVGLALAIVISAGGWLHLRALTRDAALLDEQLRRHRAVFEQVSQEMVSWRELQAKIWEPFGPALAPGDGDRGIGGATKTDPERPGPSPSDELKRLSQEVREQTESLRALERLMTRAGRALAALPSRWPVRGAVNSEFGYRHSPWSNVRGFHAGIDIRAARGTPVYAPAAGTVIQAGPGLRDDDHCQPRPGRPHPLRRPVEAQHAVGPTRGAWGAHRLHGQHRPLLGPAPVTTRSWSAGGPSIRARSFGIDCYGGSGRPQTPNCGRSGSRSPAARWCVNRATWTRSSPAPSGWAGGRRGPGP